MEANAMRYAVLVVTTALLLPRAAAAQDTPRFGVVMGYPAQVGVVWTIADRIAIRPELNWTRSTIESTATSTIFNGAGVTTTSVTTTSDSNAIGTGVTALIYVSKRDALRTYVAPRVTYSHTTTSNDLAVLLPNLVPPSTETTTTTYTVSGSLGAQYTAAKHFGIFGELGVQYGRNTLSPPSSLPLGRGDARQTSTGLRSGAGVILYFGS
jgi:hypothetical protein